MRIQWQERAPIPEPRAAHAAGCVGQEMVLVGGSRWPAPDRKLRLRRVDSYHPARNTWRPLADLPLTLDGLAGAVSAVDGRQQHLHVFGGYDGAMARPEIWRLERLEEGSGGGGAARWERAAALPSGEAVTLAAAAASGSRLYLCGGVADPDRLAGGSDRLWTLDPVGGRLTRLRPFPGTTRATHAMAGVPGALYVFGGTALTGGKVVNTREVWRYVTEQDHWQRLPDAPVAVRAWSAVAMTPQTILLLGGYRDDFGGGASPTFTSEIWRFQTDSGHWEPAGTLPLAAGAAPFILSGDLLLSAGGETAPKRRSEKTIAGHLDSGL